MQLRTLAILSLAACAAPQSEPPKTAEGEPVTEKSKVALAYEAECNDGLKTARGQFDTLEKLSGDKTVTTVLEPLNAMWVTIDYGLNKAGLYSRVHPDKGVREVGDTCEQEFSKLVTEIGLSRPLYDNVAAVDVAAESDVTQRMAEHLLRDFRRAGVDKDEATRDKVRKLKDELVEIGQEFGKNVREDVRTLALDSVDDLEGLPQDYIDAHPPGENGKIELTTDYPDYIPFMTYAKKDDVRLKFYKLFRKRGHPKNEAVLNNMLAKRYELAGLLGYDNWAHYITEDKMIKTNTAARKFIDKIAKAAEQRASKDYAELLDRLKKDYPDVAKVGDWQKTYIEEIVKREKYSFDSQQVREYLSYEKVLGGVLTTMQKMFGVEFRTWKDAPVWHDEVDAFEIVDDGKVIGQFFLDMHPRADKYKHAAAFPIRSGVDGKQLPQAALVCNFPGGKDAKSDLMEHDQVETFFHEFGHLIHHLFGGKARWVTKSGFNTEWDFVEAPSQMLEEWAWNEETLKTFATNGKGEPIPDDLVAAMNKAREFGKGLWVAHQMFYASVSLNYYDRDPAGLDTTALMKDLQEKYSPFDYVDDTYFQYSFGHLDGYSAIYYTYMWSLVIAKDLFSVFEKEGMLNPKPADRYRKFILGPGGSKDAEVLVRDFLGRDYSFDSFASWLNKK